MEASNMRNVNMEANSTHAISDIEKEIEKLERELQRPLPPQLSDKLQSYLKSRINTHEQGVRHVLKTIYSELEFTELLSGVSISKSQIKQHDAGSSHEISGHIKKTEFQVTFEVVLNQTSDKSDTSNPVMQNLKINVKQKLPSHVKEFIDRCMKTCNVSDFFQGFTAFSEWCEHRKKTFEHFLNKYSQFVQVLDIGETNLLQAETKNGMFTITWENLIADDLTVTPILALYITSPETEKKKALHSLPGLFQDLIVKHGIETAIESVLTAA